MLNIDYRDLNTIRAKLALIAAASIVRYEKVKMNKVGDCLEASVNVEPNFDPWLFIDFDGDATLEINDDVYAAYTGNRIFRLNPGINRIRLCLSNVNYAGGKGITYNDTYIIYHAPNAFKFSIKALIISEVAEVYEDLRNQLIAVLNKALDKIMITTISPMQISMFLKHLSQYFRPLPDFLVSIYAYYSEGDLSFLRAPNFNELESEAQEALKVLDNGLNELSKIMGKRGLLYMVGYSHLDLAWLWSVDVTRQKVRRTVGDMLSIIKHYPEARFVWSNVAFLNWLKEDDPELFNRFKRLINNSIFLVGGSWVEFDANLPGGESLVRQFLYGQRFLLREFGRTTEITWLPDTFGFPASLPQILRKTGIKAFFEAKLSWSTVNKYPYSVFQWEGIDGSRVIAINSQQFWGEFHPNDIKKAVQNHTQPGVPAFQPFGRTDGGGSTTWLSMERFRTLRDVPGIPIIILDDPMNYVKILEEHIDELPIWHGELYLETHRGVYSNGTSLKKMVRKLEVDLRDLELWSALLGVKEDYEDYWHPLLEAEYHDPMGATNTKNAYDDIMGRLNSLSVRIDNKLKKVLSKAVSNDDGWYTFFNSLPWAREEIVQLERPLSGMPYQKVENGFLVKVKIPSIGIVSYEVGDGVSQGDILVNAKEGILENSVLRLYYGDGNIRVYDKEVGREVIKGFRAIACEDIAIPWSGWNLEGWYRRNCVTLKPFEIGVIESGPLRATIKFSYKFKESIINQFISLESGNRLIKVRINADWRERFIVLRNEYILDIKGEHASFEIPYGVIERSNKPSNSWERAKFEVPVARWGDLWDNDYGVALINKGLQGYSAFDNTIGITILRSPMFPNPFLDYGKVDVEYAVYPHKGSWIEAQVPRKAQEFNVPLRIMKGRSVERSFIEIDNPCILLEAVKWAEDEGGSIILRLWESCGNETKTSIKLQGKYSSSVETDLLERILGNVDLKDLNFKPYEIKTILIRGWNPT